MGSARAPFLVATVIFAMQSLVTGAILLVTSGMKKTRAGSGDAARPGHHLKLIEEALLVYSVISTTSFCGYALLAFGLVAPPVEMAGPHIWFRNAVWLVTTPLQWYVFCRTCTRASQHDVASIMAHAVIMQVTGLCCLATGSSTLWVVMFVACSLSVVAMFWKALTIPLIDSFELIVRPTLYFELALWTACPVVLGARAAGLIGVWTEQALMFTVLDVCAKTITLITILTTELYIILQRAQRRHSRKCIRLQWGSRPTIRSSRTL
jgi:hypothetical protein